MLSSGGGRAVFCSLLTAHCSLCRNTMTTLEWLRDPTLRELLLTGGIAGAAIVLMCAVLSVLGVLKRLAFSGRGVSHSAFGGIGVAAVAGVMTAGAGLGTSQFFIVLAFCIAA